MRYFQQGSFLPRAAIAVPNLPIAALTDPANTGNRSAECVAGPSVERYDGKAASSSGGCDHSAGKERTVVRTGHQPSRIQHRMQKLACLLSAEGAPAVATPCLQAGALRHPPCTNRRSRFGSHLRAR